KTNRQWEMRATGNIQHRRVYLLLRDNLLLISLCTSRQQLSALSTSTRPLVATHTELTLLLKGAMLLL
ncbi:hypothetical protein P3392_24410, partial [Vibrio parahaemolyticus]|nr:hypothetical protein [Vibrio parahaemolyticus]